MYINREIEKQIKPFLNRKEIIAIIGPRQAGKTTFLLYLQKELEKSGKSVKFLTFEKKEDLDLFQKNIEDFKDLYQQYQVVIIDEFQYAKQGGKKIKYLFDTTKIKFIISGSSSLDLTFQTGKYLVGRIFNFTLLPFSFREYLAYTDKQIYSLLLKRMPDISFLNFRLKQSFGEVINKKLEKLFENYLVWGGYPSVILAKTNQEKQKILESISEGYLLKDIRILLQLATEDELTRLIKFLANQIGNLVEYKELSNSSGLLHKDLKRHLQILQQTYIIDLIKPFFTNKRTELVKNPKVYFFDSGLRNFVISDFRPCSERDDIGRLVENYVFNVFSRRATVLESLKFWRTKSKAEVDFIIQNRQAVIPIEVKYSSKPIIGKSLYSFIDKFSPKKAMVLTKGFIGEKKADGCKIQFIPVYYF